jgi:hypothetical protein
MSEPHISDEEKIRLGHEAFKTFVDSLGPNDIYKQILLEEFFRIILSGKYDLSLFAEEGSSGHEVGDDLQGDDESGEAEVPGPA